MAKLTKQQRVDLIYVALKDVFAGKPLGVEWVAVMAKLAQILPFRVTNWLEARGVLQYMLRKGEVRRTANVHQEIYVEL